MRNTRQGSLGSEGSDAPTLQQLMDAIRALQEVNEEYKRELERIREEAKAEQELLQDRLMAEVETSRVRMEEQVQANEELHKTNKELRKSLHQHAQHPKPFSKEIMDEPVPAHYITPNITFFTGIEDPKNHLTTFNAQMIILGGMNSICCKMFMGTFTRTTLQWFSWILDGQIASFS